MIKCYIIQANNFTFTGNPTKMPCLILSLKKKNVVFRYNEFFKISHEIKPD